MGTSARACLDRLLLESDDKAFGFKMQAVAAHILLRLGHTVLNVKRVGHPDIVTLKDGVEHRFEVEAEVRGHRKRMLEEADFVGLTATDAVGYFALAVSFPQPYWVVVPIGELIDRGARSGNATLEALRDTCLSDAWTQNHLDLLARSCQVVRERSFEQLAKRAKEGRGL